jgi:hypothetical protein
MKLVSNPGHLWSAALGAAVTAAYAFLSYKLVRGKPERAWACFCLGSLGLIGLNVVGNQYFDFRVMGEPGRLIPELELLIFFAAALLFAWMARRGTWFRAAAVALAVASLIPGLGYVRNAWRVLPPRDRYQQRVEYVLTSWIHSNLEGVRVLATGSVRFWYNAWFDLPQLGGGSEQGLLNINAQYAQVNALANPSADTGIHWLQAMGVGAVIVHDKNSAEIYHDWANPEKFEGKLATAYDNHAGDRIYLDPRRSPALARVVDAGRMRAIAPLVHEADDAALRGYLDVVEHGPEASPTLQRLGTDAMRIQARLQPGQLVLVQETYDPAWRSYTGGRPVPIARDPIGFLLLDPGPGDHDLLLRFETPLENRIGIALTVLSALVLGWLVWRP